MTDSAKPTINLHTKLAEVMRAVESIPKNGYNSAQSYKFTRAADLAAKVRVEFASRNITMLPTRVQLVSSLASPSGKQNVATIRATYTLTDGDSGESIEIESFGQGADSGDKATNKALTSALKYALLTALMVPQDDDPEADLATDRAAKSEQPAPRATAVGQPASDLATPAQKRLIRHEAAQAGLTDDQLHMLSFLATGKQSSKQYQKSDVDKMLSAFKDKALLSEVLNAASVEQSIPSQE